MQLLFGHPPRVQPFFGYRSATRLVIAARALRMAEPRWDRRGTLRKMRLLYGQFTSNEVPDLAVTLRLAPPGGPEIVATAVTDREGYVRFDIALDPPWPLPPDPMWEVGAVEWINRRGQQSAQAYVLAPDRDARLAVISDIDDTIIETGSHDLRRNWRRVLAQMPAERAAAPGAAAFYGLLGGGAVGERVPATHRPFFYVSSSPWNLFDYLVAFQKEHGLPQGPLMLRDWAWNRATIGHGGHAAHKSAAIGNLVGFYPEVRFALVGDDTQEDAIAYAEAVAAHPGRIAAVFIRQATGRALDPAEEIAIASIRDAGVPLWLGSAYDIGQDFLATLGFTPGGETTRIVETLKAAEAAADPAPASAPVQPEPG